MEEFSVKLPTQPIKMVQMNKFRGGAIPIITNKKPIQKKGNPFNRKPIISSKPTTITRKSKIIPKPIVFT